MLASDEEAAKMKPVRVEQYSENTFYILDAHDDCLPYYIVRYPIGGGDYTYSVWTVKPLSPDSRFLKGGFHGKTECVVWLREFLKEGGLTWG